MKKRIVNIWDIFNSWKVIYESSKKNNKRYFLCECLCGKKKNVVLQDLTNGKSKCCWWCKWLYYHPLYPIYNAMKNRCENTNNKQYKNYGARWINCRWKTLDNFLQDMEHGYIRWLTIDRIDNNWDYCKENCRWVDINVQAQNKRNNIIPWWLSKKCRELWLNYNTVRQRLYRWKPVENILY